MLWSMTAPSDIEGEPGATDPAERRAWHEAGHAVGYWYSGFQLARMSLSGEGGGETVALEATGSRDAMERLGDEAWLTSLPGNAVEVERGELALDRGSCRLVETSGRQLDDGATHLDAVVADVGPERALQLWDRALDVVRLCWPAVEAVAQALLATPGGELGTHELALLRNNMPLSRAEVSGIVRGGTGVAIVSDVPGREWVALTAAEAGLMRDLMLYDHDLAFVERVATRLVSDTSLSDDERRALYTAAVLVYAKCFGADARARLDTAYLRRLEESLRVAHGRFMQIRSIHIAHSESELEQAHVLIGILPEPMTPRVQGIVQTVLAHHADGASHVSQLMALTRAVRSVVDAALEAQRDRIRTLIRDLGEDDFLSRPRVTEIAGISDEVRRRR